MRVATPYYGVPIGIEPHAKESSILLWWFERGDSRHAFFSEKDKIDAYCVRSIQGQ